MQIFFVLLLVASISLFSEKAGAHILKCYINSESEAVEKCPEEYSSCFSTRCAYDNGTATLRKGCAKVETETFCRNFESICAEFGGEADCYFCFDDLCNEVDYPGQNCSKLIAAGPLCFFIILMLLFFSIILAIISSA